jgi:hypothetical protein
VGHQGKEGNEMKMITVFLSDTDEKYLARIKELRCPNVEVTDEELLKRGLVTYWLASEQRAKEAKTPQEERADKRLREESMGLTDNWREYDG